MLKSNHVANFRALGRRPRLLTTLLLAALANACEPDTSCAETATCPLDDKGDASSDRISSDSGNVNGADVGTDGGTRTDASSDRAETTDVTASTDRDENLDTRNRNDAVEAVISVDVVDAVVAPDSRDAGSIGPDSRDAADPPRDTAVDPLPDANGSSQDSGADAGNCVADAGSSPTDTPCLINERYGIFVSPKGTDATGTGTRDKPFRTLMRGLQAAKQETGRVFACEDGTGYSDAITVDATLDGLALYGGFDCASWSLTGTTRCRLQTVTSPTVTVKGTTLGFRVERFELIAGDAAPGASSMGVLLDSSVNVLFRNVKIVAGKAGGGLAGTAGIAGADGDMPGAAQNGTAATCDGSHLSRPGAWSNASVCGSRGGTGLGANPTGDAQAESGVPMTGVTPPNRYNGGGGFLGDPASEGSNGDPGDLGSPNTSQGAFSATGFTTAPAASGGTSGHTAQGGGGGVSRGTLDDALCESAVGGAGGMGGCGGTPGLGGSAGGASVTVLSWSSGITLESCELTAGQGGAGGKGGAGGAGGLGADGGAGGAAYVNNGEVLAPAGENGAKGGNGGPGGSGAGGNGGPSYGIVYKGTRPTQNSTTVTQGNGGAKGIGGSVAGRAAPDGLDGPSAKELAL